MENSVNNGNQFISSKDSDEIRTMLTKRNHVEIMMGRETNEIIEELFESLFIKVSKDIKED